MADIGATVGRILPFDPTPNFQLSRNGGLLPGVGYDSAALASRNTSISTNSGTGLNLDNPFARLSGQINNNTTTGTGTYGSNTGTASGAYTGSGDAGADAAQAAADAQERAAALYGIDGSLAQANDGLGRLDAQRDTGYGNIDRDYQSAYDRLTGQRRRTEADFNQNRTDQLNQYQGARNQSASNARNFMESSQRRLGAAGAGGGSAARFAVPNAAQQMAAQGNAQAQSTNSRNIGALTQNFNRATDDFKNSESDLSRQREQGRNDFTSQIEQQRAELLNTIGQLTGQRVIAEGGDFNAARAASQPYTSRIGEILNRIQGLAATPAIREQQVTVGRPDLSGYEFSRPEAEQVAQQDPTLNPILAALFGQQPDEQQAQQLQLA